MMLGHFAHTQPLGSGLLAWTWGAPEIILIVVVVLLLFGGRKLPELARGLGRGLRLFKNEVKGVKDEIDDAVTDEDEAPKPAAKTDDDQKQS